MNMPVKNSDVTDIEDIVVRSLRAVLIDATARQRQQGRFHSSATCDLAGLLEIGANARAFQEMKVAKQPSPLCVRAYHYQRCEAVRRNSRANRQDTQAPSSWRVNSLFYALKASRHAQAHRGNANANPTGQPLTTEERIELMFELHELIQESLAGASFVQSVTRGIMRKASQDVKSHLIDVDFLNMIYVKGTPLKHVSTSVLIPVIDPANKCQRLVQMSRYHAVTQLVPREEDTTMNVDERTRVLFWQALATKRYHVSEMGLIRERFETCTLLCRTALNENRDVHTHARLMCTLARCVRFSDVNDDSAKEAVYKEVLELCEEARRQSLDCHCEAHSICAEIHLLNRNLPECIASTQAAVAADDGSQDANEARAWMAAALLRQEGEPSARQESLRQAKLQAEIVLKRVPSHTFAQQTLVSALYNLGEWSQANLLCEQAISVSRKNTHLHALMARIQIELGEGTRAREFASDALRIDPSNKSAQKTLRRLNRDALVICEWCCLVALFLLLVVCDNAFSSLKERL